MLLLAGQEAAEIRELLGYELPEIVECKNASRPLRSLTTGSRRTPNDRIFLTVMHPSLKLHAIVVPVREALILLPEIRYQGSDEHTSPLRARRSASTCRWGTPTLFLDEPLWLESEMCPWTCVPGPTPHVVTTPSHVRPAQTGRLVRRR
jgi:hypothetical protein